MLLIPHTEIHQTDENVFNTFSFAALLFKQTSSLLTLKQTSVKHRFTFKLPRQQSSKLPLPKNSNNLNYIQYNKIRK